MQAPAQHAEDAVAREIERVIAREVDDQRLKALLETPGGFDQPLWTLAVEQGWPAFQWGQTRLIMFRCPAPASAATRRRVTAAIFFAKRSGRIGVRPELDQLDPSH